MKILENGNLEMDWRCPVYTNFINLTALNDLLIPTLTFLELVKGVQIIEVGLYYFCHLSHNYKKSMLLY